MKRHFQRFGVSLVVAASLVACGTLLSVDPDETPALAPDAGNAGSDCGASGDTGARGARGAFTVTEQSSPEHDVTAKPVGPYPVVVEYE